MSPHVQEMHMTIMITCIEVTIFKGQLCDETLNYGPCTCHMLKASHLAMFCA